MASRRLSPRFDRPDFIGRLVRDSFVRFMDELGVGIAEGYDDISAAQNQLMVMIDEDGSRITDLAQRANVTKQSMAEAVSGLEARGFVERRPDPTDGRAKLVVLTAEGWGAIRFGLQVALGVHAHWEDVLGEAKMARLMKLLRELVDKLDVERSSDDTDD
jgi:DNA-binding MarR family transcriptional regulator